MRFDGKFILCEDAFLPFVQKYVIKCFQIVRRIIMIQRNVLSLFYIFEIIKYLKRVMSH